MTGNKPIYYWDACVYTAWLHQEAAYQEWLPAVNAIALENKERKNVIVTSALTLIEVLYLNHNQSQIFNNSFNHDAHQLIEVERPIILKAKPYCEWYLHARTDTKVLAVPDAVHLATASVYGAHEFHTFDNGGKRGCSLLKLNENVAGDRLKICRPYAAQQTLLLPPP